MRSRSHASLPKLQEQSKAENGLRYYNVRPSPHNFRQLRFEREDSLRETEPRKEEESQQMVPSGSKGSLGSVAKENGKRFSLLNTDDKPVSKTIRECIYRMLYNAEEVEEKG
jgi:hypothetical protein